MLTVRITQAVVAAGTVAVPFVIPQPADSVEFLTDLDAVLPLYLIAGKRIQNGTFSADSEDFNSDNFGCARLSFFLANFDLRSCRAVSR